MNKPLIFTVVFFLLVFGAIIRFNQKADPMYVAEPAIRHYLVDTLKKPESLDIRAMKAVEVSKGWTVTCTYRARNDWNSVVEKTSKFWVSPDGKVVTPLPE